MGGPARRRAAPVPRDPQPRLLRAAGDIGAADERLAPRLAGTVVDDILAAVPGDWFAPRTRAEYAAYLHRRLASPRGFAAEAEEARRAA